MQGTCAPCLAALLPLLLLLLLLCLARVCAISRLKGFLLPLSCCGPPMEGERGSDRQGTGQPDSAVWSKAVGMENGMRWV